MNVFPGNYSQYRYSDKYSSSYNSVSTSSQANEELSKNHVEPANINHTIAPNLEKSENKRQLSYKEKREFEAIESALPMLEKEKTDLEQMLVSANISYEEIEKTTKRIAEIAEELSEKELRWLELSEL